MKLVLLVLQQRATKRLLHLTLTLSRRLPAVEADLFHDQVDIRHDAFDDHVRVL